VESFWLIKKGGIYIYSKASAQIGLLVWPVEEMRVRPIEKPGERTLSRRKKRGEKKRKMKFRRKGRLLGPCVFPQLVGNIIKCPGVKNDARGKKEG